MPWARLDDGIYENAKLLAVKKPAVRWLYVAAIAFCRRHETGGELSHAQMKALVRQQEVPRDSAAQLVEVGLLAEVQVGYTIHDFETYNPSTSTERVRKHRANETRMKRDGTPPPVSGTPLARAPRAGLGTQQETSGRQPDPTPTPTPSGEQPGPGDWATLLEGCQMLMGRPLSGKEIQAAERLMVEAPRTTVEAALKRMDEYREWRASEGKDPARSLELYVASVVKQDRHLADRGVLRPRVAIQ